MVRFLECGGDQEHDPVEQLRFFCSIAMKPQDWLDVEKLFDGVIEARGAPIAELRAGVEALPIITIPGVNVIGRNAVLALIDKMGGKV